MTMREKIARALAKTHDYREHDEVGGAPAWKMYERDADAVLDVLMEPTGNMLEAGCIAASDYEDRNPHEGFSIPDNDPVSMFVFRAMIQAAKEGNE